MKSIFRFVLLMAVVALGFAGLTPANVSAQGACTLAADDCALLEASAAVAADQYTKFTIESFSFVMNLTGSPTGDVAIDV
jgi:hypothetical protein